MADRELRDTGRARSGLDVLSSRARAEILDEVIRREVTGGARVDHRDTVTAVLAKRSDRMLVTVDEVGTVVVDRLVRAGPHHKRYIAVIATAIVAAMLVILTTGQLDILRA